MKEFPSKEGYEYDLSLFKERLCPSPNKIRNLLQILKNPSNETKKLCEDFSSTNDLLPIIKSFRKKLRVKYNIRLEIKLKF